MEATLNAESYALVEKYAYKFAYSKDSFQYEEYLSAGLEGLIKAINTYKEDKNTQFKSYATRCILNAMSTSNKVQKRFDLVHDDNVVLDELDGLSDEMKEDNMVDVAKRIILDVNKNNKRNAEMFMLNIGITDAPMDYNELSVKFNVTAERVRQVCVATRRNIMRDKEATELLYSFVG